MGLAQQAAADRRVHREPAHRLLRAEELQHLVLLRLAGAAGARHAARDRHLPHHVLQARRAHLVRLRRIHHARGGLRLAHPLPALDRRLGVLHRRVPAHVQGAPLRLVPGAAGAAVAHRDAGLPRAHGGGLHGLRAALGQHVLLGGSGHRQPLRHHPRDRQAPGGVDPRRLRHRRCDAESLLCAARRGHTARSALTGDAAPGGAAPDRLE